MDDLISVPSTKGLDAYIQKALQPTQGTTPFQGFLNWKSKAYQLMTQHPPVVSFDITSDIAAYLMSSCEQGHRNCN